MRNPKMPTQEPERPKGPIPLADAKAIACKGTDGKHSFTQGQSGAILSCMNCGLQVVVDERPQP